MITSYLALKIAECAFGGTEFPENWFALPLTSAAGLTKAGGSFQSLVTFIPPTAQPAALTWAYYSGAPPYVRSNGFSFLNQTTDPPVSWRVGYIALFLALELALYLRVNVSIPAGESIGVPNGVVFSLSSPGG